MQSPGRVIGTWKAARSSGWTSASPSARRSAGVRAASGIAVVSISTVAIAQSPASRATPCAALAASSSAVSSALRGLEVGQARPEPVELVDLRGQERDRAGPGVAVAVC